MSRSALSIAADYIDPPDDTWRPEPHQIPPAGDWFVWLLLGGRGAGKTAAAARYMHEHINGPPCVSGVPGGHWPAIIAPTLGDAVTSCVNGPSGLRLHDPGVKVSQTVGGAMVRWSNGVEAKLFGAHTPEDVERLRSGGNRCIVWAEELAAWRYIDDCWQHMRYGLRLGPRPHVVASTTPKNKTIIKKLVKAYLSGEVTEELGRVVVTKATTNDNPHLPKHIKAMLFADYGGTRLGRQELFAEILEDVEGALWTPSIIEDGRIGFSQMPQNLDLIVVSVDPPAKQTGAECGIIVQGVKHRYKPIADDPEQKLSHGFVLADCSLYGSPNEWGMAVVEAFDDWGANTVVAEVNNGGDMVKATMRNIRDTLPVEEVHASRGKAIRAEPVVALYEQTRWHHVGNFPMLEDQQTSWDKDDPPDDWSPDRMDALVWGAWKLAVGRSQAYTHKMADRRLRGRR